MAADSDSMRSVLGCPLLASWIAYKFYLSQDFNSIPALDTRPLRIPPLPPQNGNIASLPPSSSPFHRFEHVFLFFIFFLVRSFCLASPFFPLSEVYASFPLEPRDA